MDYNPELLAKIPNTHEVFERGSEPIESVGGWLYVDVEVVEPAHQVWLDPQWCGWYDYGTCRLLARPKQHEPWVDHSIPLPGPDYEWARAGKPLGREAMWWSGHRWMSQPMWWRTPESWRKSYGRWPLAVRKTPQPETLGATSSFTPPTTEPAHDRRAADLTETARWQTRLTGRDLMGPGYESPPEVTVGVQEQWGEEFER